MKNYYFTIVIVVLIITGCNKGDQMFWNTNHKEIFTEFIDSKTGKVISTSKMPIEQIPESFELDTSLDMPDGKYTVINAEPKNKSEFAKTGKLKVTLSKVEMINPADLLFSIPTIENTFFDITTNTTGKKYLIIHEDDWRQIELISDAYDHEIDEEFILIKNIYDTEMKGNYYKKVHVRNKIPFPMEKVTVDYEKLLSNINIQTKYDGFSLANNQVAANSFAFETKNKTIIFGTLKNKNITTICFKYLTNSDAELDKFCTENRLILVDWIKMEKRIF